jgi:hypothetical protein
VSVNPEDGTPVATQRKLKPSHQNVDHALVQLASIARQLETQHRRLDPFFAHVATAFAKGELHDAQTAIFQLEGVLDVHFLFEEKTLFPAIRSAFPETGDELAILCGEHAQARANLRVAVAETLESQLGRAGDALVKCTLFMERHERRELALVNNAFKSALSLLNLEHIKPLTDSTKQ